MSLALRLVALAGLVLASLASAGGAGPPVSSAPVLRASLVGAAAANQSLKVRLSLTNAAAQPYLVPAPLCPVSVTVRARASGAVVVPDPAPAIDCLPAAQPNVGAGKTVVIDWAVSALPAGRYWLDLSLGFGKLSAAPLAVDVK